MPAFGKHHIKLMVVVFYIWLLEIFLFQGLYVLDLLKESIDGENARIHPIIAVFLSKTLQLVPG